MLRSVILAGLLLVVASPFAPGEQNWPKFRGVAGTGEMPAGVPATWSATENVAWKAPLAGSGWSSPIVWQGRVFVTSFIAPGDDGKPKLGFYLQGGKIPAGKCRWVVTCLDAKTGMPLWEKTAQTGTPKRPIHPKNIYAPATPSTDGERLIAYFAEVGLVCYDLAGKELWRKANVSQPTRSEWGPGASPVLHAGRVYLVNDNEEKSYLAAYDAATGNELLRVDRPEKTSWATPFLWQHAGRAEIVTSASDKARSYDLEGKLLWEIGPNSEICIPTPLAAHGLLYVATGYEFGGKVRPIYAIRPGASGDISLGDDATASAAVAWSLPSAGGYNPSPLIYGDHLYVLYSQGFFACFDAKTGRELYKKQRLGGNYTASPWAADGKVFCLGEDGVTTVIAAGPKFEVLHKNTLGESALATPAAAEGALFLRTTGGLFCLRAK